MAITGFWKWSGLLPTTSTPIAPLVVPSWANQRWRHRVGGDALLALAAAATVLSALSGAPVRDLVPTLVLLPWLALWALPSWLGIGLAGANLALAMSQGALDTSAIALVGGLWFVLLVVWFQNQGWLPWVFLLTWCAWALAGGAMVWTQRDGASVAELGVGLLLLALLWGVARAHRPQAPRWQGWGGGVATGVQGWHATRLAIGVAAVAIEVAWLVGRPSAWALAIAVLLPWILLGWAASDSTTSVVVWARWAFVSATSIFLVVRSQTLADPDRELDLIAVCAMLWGGLALAWLLDGRWRRPLFAGGAAAGLTVAANVWWQGQPPPAQTGAIAAAILAIVTVAIAGLAVARMRVREHPRSVATYAAFASDRPFLAMPSEADTSATIATVAPQPVWARAVPAAVLAGKQAEAAMRELMLTRLPAGTWVLSELTLPGLRGDLDVVVIGASGVFVLEVKYWAGRIMCGGDGHAWTRQRRGLVETVGDPAGQLQSEVEAVERFWHARSNAARGVGGILIFAHPRCEVDAAAAPILVLAPRSVPAVIRAGLPGPRLSASEQVGLVKLIASVQPATWDQNRGMQQAWGPT